MKHNTARAPLGLVQGNSTQLNRIYNFCHRTQPGSILACMCGNKSAPPPPPEPYQLYYRLSVSDTDASLNASETEFVTEPVDGVYRGIENRYLCTDTSFTAYSPDWILTFIGYRTPGAAGKAGLYPDIPGMYNETIYLTDKTGQEHVCAVANYVDGGDTFVTTQPSIDYAIWCSAGRFSRYRTLRILFYNDGYPATGATGKVRIMQFL